MSLRERERFDFGTGGYDGPPNPFEFDRGGSGRFPAWSTHAISFLLGGITFSSLLLADGSSRARAAGLRRLRLGGSPQPLVVEPPTHICADIS